MARLLRSGGSWNGLPCRHQNTPSHSRSLVASDFLPTPPLGGEEVQYKFRSRLDHLGRNFNVAHAASSFRAPIISTTCFAASTHVPSLPENIRITRPSIMLTSVGLSSVASRSGNTALTVNIDPAYS